MHLCKTSRRFNPSIWPGGCWGTMECSFESTRRRSLVGSIKAVSAHNIRRIVQHRTSVEYLDIFCNYVQVAQRSLTEISWSAAYLSHLARFGVPNWLRGTAYLPMPPGKGLCRCCLWCSTEVHIEVRAGWWDIYTLYTWV